LAKGQAESEAAWWRGKSEPTIGCRARRGTGFGARPRAAVGGRRRGCCGTPEVPAPWRQVRD